MARTCNVGGVDKSLRIIIGVVAVALVIFASLSTLWTVVALVVAAIMFVTVLARFCPVNALFGLNTCKQKAEAV